MEKQQFLIGDTCSNCCFAIVMLVFGGVPSIILQPFFGGGTGRQFMQQTSSHGKSPTDSQDLLPSQLSHHKQNTLVLIHNFLVKTTSEK